MRLLTLRPWSALGVGTEGAMHAAALALGTIFLFTWASPDAARAEAFVDLYLGGAVTQDADATAKIGPVPGFPQIVTSAPIEFIPGVSVGIRGGYWLDSVPLVGFALNAAYFDADEDAPPGPSVKLDVFPISALLMLRYPLLKDSNFPQGRVQPYAGAGPGAFISKAELDLSPGGLPEDFQDTIVDVGVNVAAGVKFHVWTGFPAESGSLAIFVEYGFTHFKPDFKDNIGGVVPIELGVDRLDTHHAVAGLGFHF